ncbi:MAG: response regulator receiver protein, partial [uncultured Rubrobacteraceae bacterium]
GKDHSPGGGQPGRRDTDPARPQEEQHRQRGGGGSRRGRGSGLPVRHGAIRGARPQRHAAGDTPGPQAAQGRWPGGLEAPPRQRTDEPAACRHPHLLQGAAGPRGRIRLRGEQLHPQARRFRPVCRGGAPARALLAGPERDPQAGRL